MSVGNAIKRIIVFFRTQVNVKQILLTDDEIEVGNAGSALLDSPDPSKERADCRTVHREAIESTRSGVPNAYIPECDANGNFNRVQCHKVRDVLGSGCGTVGRAVASDTRDARFESSYLQILFSNNCIEKTYLK